MKPALFSAILLPLLTAALPAETVGHWDLDALKQPPAMRWEDETGPVRSLIYQGEPDAKGARTEVFAFYASPATDGAKTKPPFPGVILIHGGGGTAFADWVHLWARRGYAALAMDLNGSRPPAPEYDPRTGLALGNGHRGQRTRLPLGGLEHGHPQKFGSIGGTHLDDWPYHAAASVIRAHSLLRGFPEVDAGRTAVTGISWGGYTTCLVASLDDRFKAAVPVYGCGFLHEGESVQKPSIDALGERRMDWVRAYDPGSLLPRAKVPLLFVNGTNDKHYVLDSYMKSYAVVTAPKQLRIQVNMPHGHPPGWAPQEIGLFIDSHCAGGTPLPLPGQPVIQDGKATLECQSATALKSAALHYTTDTGLRSERKWTTVPAGLAANTYTSGQSAAHITRITAPAPPPEANTWFLSVTDERDAMVSTTVQFSP